MKQAAAEDTCGSTWAATCASMPRSRGAAIACVNEHGDRRPEPGESGAATRVVESTANFVTQQSGAQFWLVARDDRAELPTAGDMRDRDDFRRWVA